MEIPVYLFTGFLESGKTTFIQNTLQDERFNKGENTLILLLEEGIEEYDISKMPHQNIFIETFENIEDVTQEKLNSIVRKNKIERVIIELNGMWLTTDLYPRLPQNWAIYQEMCFLDAGSFLSFNQNMRQLHLYKLLSEQVYQVHLYFQDNQLQDELLFLRAYFQPSLCIRLPGFPDTKH